MIVDGLASKLDVASILALRVSAQVQQLDQQRERVSSALVATSNLLHLRSCASAKDLMLPLVRRTLSLFVDRVAGLAHSLVRQGSTPRRVWMQVRRLSWPGTKIKKKRQEIQQVGRIFIHRDEERLTS